MFFYWAWPKKIRPLFSYCILWSKCTKWPCPVLIQQLHWTILMEKLRPIEESLFSVFDHTFSNALICNLHARSKNFSNKLLIECNYSNMFFFRRWSHFFVELANVHYTSPQDIWGNCFEKLQNFTLLRHKEQKKCSVMLIQKLTRLINNFAEKYSWESWKPMVFPIRAEIFCLPLSCSHSVFNATSRAVSLKTFLKEIENFL